MFLTKDNLDYTPYIITDIIAMPLLRYNQKNTIQTKIKKIRIKSIIRKI